MKRITLFIIAILMGSSLGLEAQRVAVRSNLLALATGDINLEGSLMLGNKFSFHTSVHAKPITFGYSVPVGVLRFFENEREYKNPATQIGKVHYREYYSLIPGIRFWSHGVYNRGFFLGIHAIGMMFRWGGDMYDANYRKGFGVGAGVTVGYSYELSRRWNIEAEIGGGGMMRFYDRIHASTGEIVKSGRGFSMLPSIGVSLVYLIK